MGDWIVDHFGWILAGLGALLVAGIAYGIVAMNDWEGRCADAGGIVESRYIGDTVTYVNSGNGVQTPIIVQNYTYHCMVGGSEIQV